MIRRLTVIIAMLVLALATPAVAQGPDYTHGFIPPEIADKPRELADQEQSGWAMCLAGEIRNDSLIVQSIAPAVAFECDASFVGSARGLTAEQCDVAQPKEAAVALAHRLQADFEHSSDYVQAGHVQLD